VIFVDKKSRVAKRAGVDIAKAIDRAVFPGCQGGPHVNQIAATAVAFHEADTARFRNYARQMVKNARALGGELQKLGWRLISGGTDTHLILVDVAARGLGSKEASTKLEAQGIIVNKNAIPYDPRPPMDPSGIRLGTPALTSRGMKEEDMRKIARMIDGVLLRGENVRADVKRLCRKYPLWYKV
jgi:glycine hydroxymethyltransferase